MSIKDMVPRLHRGRELSARRGELEPFHEFQREMNRLLEDFFTDLPVARWGGREMAAVEFSPRVDVSETDKEVVVSAELPGMDEKDIAVEMEEDAVTIRGERKEDKENKGRNWYTREQSYGSFRRVVQLPANVQGDKAAARFRKGVLTVTIPKKETEPSRRKTINIESD